MDPWQRNFALKHRLVALPLLLICALMCGKQVVSGIEN